MRYSEQEIIRLLKLQDIPEGQQQQMVERVSGLAEMEMLQVVQGLLGDDEYEAFKVMIDRDPEFDEVADWLKEKDINFQEVYDALVNEIVDEIRTDVEEVMSAP
jgi:hypothetical protein